MITIGQRIKAAREKRSWTQQELSWELARVAPPKGFSLSTIANWEQGRNKPSERAIWALEKALSTKLRK